MRASSKKRVLEEVEIPEAEAVEVHIPAGLTLQAMGMTGIDEPPAPEEPEYFKPCALPSRREERKILGPVQDRDSCFFCSHGDKRNDTRLPVEDVNKLVEMIRQHTGRMKTAILARMVAKNYEIFRQRINRSLKRGEEPLEFMSAATVAHHIRRHHQDPEVKQVVILEALQELREEIFDNGVMEKNSKTKKRRANRGQIDCLEKIIKMEFAVQSKDPSKLAFYAAGARINPTIHKQGVMASHMRDLYSFWGNAATK